jgi:hypothetical protein
VRADGDDLVVDALVVAHAHDADRARRDDAQRVHGALLQHEHVEGVAVVAVGARDEAVVGRVVHRAEQHAVEAEEAVSLSTSYLFLLPCGTSITAGKPAAITCSST